jgi:hypothetical protein
MAWVPCSPTGRVYSATAAPSEREAVFFSLRFPVGETISFLPVSSFPWFHQRRQRWGLPCWPRSSCPPSSSPPTTSWGTRCGASRRALICTAPGRPTGRSSSVTTSVSPCLPCSSPRNNGIILSLDTVFRFENGFYDVVQVSRAEHRQRPLQDLQRQQPSGRPARLLRRALLRV